MKKVAKLLVWFIVLLIGCTEVFIPPTSGSKQILVVDGMITNAAETYTIKLSYASSYSSGAAVTPVNNAVVTVNDGLGDEYGFRDIGNGIYVSNPSSFTANDWTDLYPGYPNQ